MDVPRLPSKNQLRKAGIIVREWWLGGRQRILLTDEVDQAFTRLDLYRAAHQVPLTKATMTLRSMVRTIGASGVVSQRLKRHVSIVQKLAREPHMQLTTMQDIAGCRAVLESEQQVRRIQHRWGSRTRVWAIRKLRDYIAHPKPSGYRAVHVVVRDGEGFFVEVQLRTQVQHEWAVAVERVGGRIREDLKGGRGPREVLEFFQVVSRAMKLEEEGQAVPRDLVLEVRHARQRAEPFLSRGR